VVSLINWTLEHTEYSDTYWTKGFVKHPAAAGIKAEQLTALLTMGVERSLGSGAPAGKVSQTLLSQ
jgi:hypothetical protein